jgi:hypothetical protein
MTIEEVRVLLRSIHYDIASKDWLGLDQRLDNLDTDNLCPTYVIAVLRSTFTVNTKLDRWAPAVERARRSFGKDETLLKGLY